ncbi:GTP pyrophosphokinase family protein [Pantoea sp. DY-5]|uniref:GTP pyrophosphokinase n=1 Tax=Pantoea sp. DY-5 TaxID=2871488 RepID=UPI001C94A8DE|nr:hypothetical protein [Pantoea sp. DY-5]MBY4838556.1 hypothetical protein [Pantoea sp. DY-5]
MKLDILKEQYAAHRIKAETFKKELIGQVESILSKNDVTLGVPIESRIKNMNSIIDKDSRKSLTINSLLELDDFIGLRVILLFKRDMEKVTKCLHENFNIIKSEDKLEMLSEDKFGYQSYHLILKMPDEWLKVPTLSEYSDFKAEVQVRTLSQHIWAATSHKLQYKQEKSVPLPLRRAIHRVSALLEVVDLEFERVLIEREEYIDKISDVSIMENDIALDVDVLKSIAKTTLPIENELDDESFDELLSELIFNGIESASDFKEKLNKGLAEALADDKRRVRVLKTKDNEDGELDDIEWSRVSRGVYYSHVGLIRIAMSNVMGDDYIITDNDE